MNKYVRYLMVLVALGTFILLSGCDNRPLDQREYSKTTMSNIPELADCVYIKIDDVRIIRCPLSSTTTSYTVPQGKTRKTVTTTVISGKAE
jgi:hypothetical protein